MTEEVFKTAERLRSQIKYYEKSIIELMRMSNSEITSITFRNPDVRYKDVDFS